MFLRLRLPRHSDYDDTFFWSGECRDNEVRLYNRIRVSFDGFFHSWLFRSLCPKIGSNFHFDAFFLEKISWFYKKMEEVIWFSVRKINTPTNFIRLRSKLTLQMCQKVKSFRWENDSKSAQDMHFYNFFLDKQLPLNKNEKRYSFFL